MYSLLSKALFSLSAETAHDVTLELLGAASRLRLLPALAPSVPAYKVNVMGIEFPNPVGLAAGLDKNGDYLNSLAALGFGFVELGTVTPKPQPGNPKPRLFRLAKKQAIINRMGFNNLGVDHLVSNIEKANFKGVLGINIGKNLTTSIEQAVEDYVFCLHKVYSYASYIVVNISSPNTQDLRSLQYGQALYALLERLKQEQDILSQKHAKYVPLVIKIAPDLDADSLSEVAESLLYHNVDGVIATNTTLSRSGVEGHADANETGGLSGAPLQCLSTEVIQKLYGYLGDTVPIIGVGGITSTADAQAKFNAGAKLVQVYSGLIYKGPQLITDCVHAATAAHHS